MEVAKYEDETPEEGHHFFTCGSEQSLVHAAVEVGKYTADGRWLFYCQFDALLQQRDLQHILD